MTTEIAGENWKKADVVFEDKSFIFLHRDEGDHIFASLQRTASFYEQELLGVLRTLLRPGDWVVDAGANIGNHAIYFAGVCGCNVLAFEPNPVAAEILRKNVEINGLGDRIEIHEVALGSRAGSGDLVVPNEHNLGMVSVQEAEVGSGAIRIDLLSNYVGSRTIRLLKIDAEGMDYEVLAGAEEVLARDGCAVSIEAAKREEFLKIETLVERHGYVAAGCYNYTPTHVFLHERQDELAPFVRRMSRQISLDYIDRADIRDAFARGRRETSNQIGYLLSAFNQHSKDLPAALEKAQSSGTDAIRQHMDAGLLQVGKEIAGLVGKAGDITSGIDQAKNGLDSIVSIISKLEEKLDQRLSALEARSDHLADALVSLKASSDNRIAELTQTLGQVDATTSARITEVVQALQQFEDRTHARHETALTNWKDSIDALFHCTVLAAEADNLQEAAQAQEQLLLRRDVDVLQRQLSADGGGAWSTAQLSQSQGSVARSLKPDSVWHVERHDRAADDAASEPIEDDGNNLRETMLQRSEVIAEESFEDGWSGRGWVNGKGSLEDGGVVRATEDGDSGFITRKFPFENGGIVEVSIHIRDIDEGASGLVASIENNAGDGVGHTVSLCKGIVTFRAFALGRTQELKVRIFAQNCKAGASFTVSKLLIRRLHPDAHQRAVRSSVGEPVLASMASIPSRGEMLADSVNSLLAQCDKVRVFLNNYPDVPAFLDHPRVEVKRSQDWDDRGDAGKVYWLEHDKESGYRLLVDDDLIFPPDFAEVMCAKVASRNKKVIYATHGVILRQPINKYYEPGSRAVTFHFASPLERDRAIHISTTGCTCFHSETIRMKWADFKYCNSADIWLTLYAQKHNIPVLTPARPQNWIRENKSVSATENIYSSSLKKTKTRFDSSTVQDAMLKHNWPLSIRCGQGRKKYSLLVRIDKTDQLAESINQFIRVHEHAAEWVVMLAYDRKVAALENAVANNFIDRETHLIDLSDANNVFTQATTLMEKTGIDALLAVDGSSLSNVSKADAVTIGVPEIRQDVRIIRLAHPASGDDVGLVLAKDADQSSALLRDIAGFCPAPSNVIGAFRSSGSQQIPLHAAREPYGLKATVNSVFERVRVLNLDRRPDRWEQVSASLGKVGIDADRFSAVDGSLPDITEEYERYFRQPRITVSSEVPPVQYQTDLYLGYASQMARIAYLERNGKKAIASRGAWGYLKSYEKILEEALEQGTESLLVFDDDVLMHKDTEALFAQAMSELPDDWLILQFGTLQYNWNAPWADWHSPLLYRTNGSAIGSHAVGMRFDIMPFLLDHVRRFDMPYDIGALSAATRAFPDRCFVIHPNLAIQSMMDSDIGTSNFQQDRKREEAAATYRWNLADYQ